jgi:hypothetical protein
LTFVAAAIRPDFNSIALRLAFVPLSVVDLAIWELAFSLKELGVFPFAFKNSAIE